MMRLPIRDHECLGELGSLTLARSPGIGYRHGMTWDDIFLALFDRCVAAYRAGNHDFESYYTPADLEFLRKIGSQKREFFDFVEDFCEDNAPSPSTALLVAAVRRDYFLTVQKGVPCEERLLTRDDVPTFGEDLEGIHYLPRILAKARAKLRGTLDPDLMFGCGGDRNFLRKHGNLHPADFLRQVWAAGGDDHKILAKLAAVSA
jgi:hypothetical protein